MMIGDVEILSIPATREVNVRPNTAPTGTFGESHGIGTTARSGSVVAEVLRETTESERVGLGGTRLESTRAEHGVADDHAETLDGREH